MINLLEAIEIMESSDNPLSIMSDERLMEFAEAVDDAGSNILTPLAEDNEGRYIRAAISFVQSGVIASMMSKKDNPIDMLRILQLMQSDLFFEIITLALKYSVGLAAVEELH